MSTTRAIAWNTGAQAVGKIISTVVGVFIIAIMTRYLGQEGFGYYSTATAFFQIFAIIIDLGINVMIVQMLGEHKGDEAYENRAVSATMTLRILTALIVLGATPFIGLLFPYALPVKIALFAIWLNFFSASLNQIVIGVQQRHLKMHIVAVSEVIGRIVLLAGLLLCIGFGLGLTSIVIVTSVSALINLLVNLIAARKYASFAWNWDPEFWKQLLARSWPIGVSILFHLAYFKADTFILSLVRPAAEVGLYSAAYRVLEILITFPFMLAGIMLPLMSHAWVQKHQEEFLRLLKQSYSAILVFAVPLVVGIMALGTQAMVAVSGEEFAESGQILKILAVATAVIYFGTISSHVVVAIDAQKRMLPMYMFVGILSLILYSIFIPIYGMWAAAWLTVLLESIIAAATTWFAVKAAPGCISIVTLGKITLAALVMGLAIMPMQHLWLPVPITAGMLIYTVMIYLTGTIKKETLKEIFSRKPIV